MNQSNQKDRTGLGICHEKCEKSDSPCDPFHKNTRDHEASRRFHKFLTHHKIQPPYIIFCHASWNCTNWTLEQLEDYLQICSITVIYMNLWEVEKDRLPFPKRWKTLGIQNDTTLIRGFFDWVNEEEASFQIPSFYVVDESYSIMTSAQVSKRGNSLEKIAPLIEEGHHCPCLAFSSPIALTPTALKQLRIDALTEYDNQKYHKAASLYSQILYHDPLCAITNYNMGALLLSKEMPFLSVHFFINVIRLDQNDATAHAVIFSVLSKLEPASVLKAYREIVRSHPENVRARHYLAALDGEGVEVSPHYVSAVFDDLADTFEDKVLNHLQYKVPWLLEEGLQQVAGLGTQIINRIIDLGCGTGLCGRVFYKYCKEMDGVDLSPSMIEKASKTNYYNKLKVGDVCEYMRNQPDCTADLILAADVWIYVGDLKAVFELMTQKIVPNGLSAFSVELWEDFSNADGEDGYCLALSGRFQHKRSYIELLSLNNNLKVLYEKEIIIRMEAGEPIPGMVFVIKRLE